MPIDYQDFQKQDFYQEAHFSNPISSQHVSVAPTNHELELYVKKIQTIFSDGFQWKDIPAIIKISAHYLNDFSNLTILEKRNSVIHILNRVIDETDTPYLPDRFTDPMFKRMVPPFAELIVPESISEFIPLIKVSGTPTDEMIFEYSQQVSNVFKDGFQWTDLVTVTRLGILFANKFENLHLNEKKHVAKQFLDYVIESTDTPFLPDYFVDPIFRELSYPCIDMIMDQLLILE